MKKINIFSIAFLFILVSLVQAQQTRKSFTFSVLDSNNNFYSELKPSDFQLSVDKLAQNIESLEIKKNDSINLTIMLDASMSQERVLPFAKAISLKLLDGVLNHDTDRVQIVRFTGKMSVEQEFTSDFEKAKKKLEAIEVAQLPKGMILGTPSISSQPTEGSTSIWDSLSKVAESMESNSNSHKAIILITDGMDTFSVEKRKKVASAIANKRIPVFSIAVADDYYGGADKSSLRSISETTGGEFFAPKKIENVDAISNRLRQSLRTSYLLTFTDSNLSSMPKKIRIKVINKELESKGVKFIFPEEI